MTNNFYLLKRIPLASNAITSFPTQTHFLTTYFLLHANGPIACSAVHSVFSMSVATLKYVD